MARTASFNPPNPLLEQEEAVDFTSVQPRHLVAAAKQVQREYMEKFKALEEALQNDAESVSAEWILEQLEKLEAPTDYLRNAAALYQNLIQIPDWEATAYQVASILDEKPHEQSRGIMEALERLNDELQDGSSSNALAIRHFLNRYRHRSIRYAEESSLQSLQESLNQIELRFIESTANNMARRGSTRQKLEDMYALVNIKSQQAKLFGYDNYVDYVLAAENRMATSRDEIASLHNLVKEKFANVKAMPLAQYPDTQQYLSLDGVLLGMFGLARAMFGIVFNESDSPRGWTSEVRLFAAVDEATGEELGSFYLDPFFRGTKARYFFLSPLHRRSIFLGANILAPAWDDMPTPLKFRDALSLVHEFGHVLQFMLAKDQPVPTHYMPQDVSEVMPQVRNALPFEVNRFPVFVASHSFRLSFYFLAYGALFVRRTCLANSSTCFGSSGAIPG